ncbi:MAG TPA: polysaccharide deacetylase family protein, partial [Candidatus Blautia excrementigallinarum]|nr:polysaccharide deacetylase family protein [Candidatus Blautia excrementigallinarum]
MDKRVLRERMRKKQQQLRRRRMMRLAGYVIGLVLVIVFVVRGIILPIAHKIGGETDKPTEIQAEATSTEVVEADPDAAIRKPLKGSGLVTKASDLTSGWHENEQGKWYQNTDGTYYAGGFQEIDGATYSFDDNGYIQTGWVTRGFDDLYFNEDGTYNPDEHKTRIALTFDDGPGEYTDQLLDCLEENNAHATFFMLGQNVGEWESTVQRMVDIGCEIGNHSYDHPSQTLLNMSSEEVSSQFQRTDEALMKACGQAATVARAPYGAADQNTFDIVQKPFFMWSLDTQDWSLMNADADYNAVMNGDLTDGSIILMHDIHEPSVQAAIRLIPDLVEKGYKLMTVSELA